MRNGYYLFRSTLVVIKLVQAPNTLLASGMAKNLLQMTYKLIGWIMAAITMQELPLTMHPKAREFLLDG